jgi:hypothetical protein
MSLATVWQPLDVADVDVIEFDYTLFAAASTITATLATCEVQRGVHATPAAVLLGLPTVVGSKVYQRVQGAGGLADVQYHIRMRAELADGRARVLAGILPITKL